ncbi:MAG: hypothetical protein HYS22_09255 [Deltaproteobacteria bacterium]|nr:hypothetical protein [Deltaproteobacteria bacterium]
MTRRIDQLPPIKLLEAGKGRGWTREDLCPERLDRYPVSRALTFSFTYNKHDHKK